MTMQQSILIITSSSTGNNIFCTPAIHFLRRYLPQAKIDVVALDALSAQVFAENPDIGQVHITDSKRVLTKLAKHYHYVIALNKNALKKFVGIDLVMAQAQISRTDVHHAEQLLWFIKDWLQHTLHIMAEILPADRQYQISASADISHLATTAVMPGRQPVINIHLGCGTTLLHGWKFFYAKRAADKKLWPLERYIALGQALIASYPEALIVITGTKNESFLAKQFSKAVPHTLNLVGKTTITDLRALMDRAQLFIAHDCGVFHVAAATNVPMLGLFGPTNHQLTGPYPPQPNRVLIVQPTMAEITVEQVLAEAQRMLSAC